MTLSGGNAEGADGRVANRREARRRLRGSRGRGRPHRNLRRNRSKVTRRSSSGTCRIPGGWILSQRTRWRRGWRRISTSTLGSLAAAEHSHCGAAHT